MRVSFKYLILYDNLYKYSKKSSEMQEIFLDIDSKGIVPHDTEDKGEYITRGTNLIGLMIKPRLRKDFFSDVKRCFPQYSMKKISLSEEIYHFLEEKYDANLRWVPCFKNDSWKFFSGESTPLRLGTNLRGYLRGYYIPIIVLHKKFNSKNTLVHELLHSIRETFHYSEEEDKIIAELFAESCRKIPLHDVFMNHPVEALKMFFKMKLTHNKLSDCFEDHADYAFIRLKRNEVEYLANRAVNNEGIAEYFKNRANPESSLRFEIMCEKLGL